MEFGNIREIGPIVLGLSVSSGLGMYLGHLINARSGDSMALWAAGGAALYGTGHYLYRNRSKIAEKCRKYRSNLTEIYSALYKFGRNKSI
jgi:hypothetical protein